MQRIKMRYSTEPRFRKYFKVMAFCHLQKTQVINMVKNIMDTTNKTGIDAAKTTFKRVV